MPTPALDFTDGRATIPLADGALLSIVNLDRRDHAAMHMDPLQALGIALGLLPPLVVHAGEDTYEVARVFERDGENYGGGPIPGWEPLEAERAWDPSTDTEYVGYGYVPLPVIEEYVATVGRA